MTLSHVLQQAARRPLRSHPGERHSSMAVSAELSGVAEVVDPADLEEVLVVSSVIEGGSFEERDLLVLKVVGSMSDPLDKDVSSDVKFS